MQRENRYFMLPQVPIIASQQCDIPFKLHFSPAPVTRRKKEKKKKPRHGNLGKKFKFVKSTKYVEKFFQTYQKVLFQKIKSPQAAMTIIHFHISTSFTS